MQHQKVKIQAFSEAESIKVETSFGKVTDEFCNKMIKSKNLSFKVKILARPGTLCGPKNCKKCQKPNPSQYVNTYIFQLCCN